MQNNNKCCKDCSERKPGCHAECTRYAEFKERLEKIKLKEGKNITNLVDIYMELTRIVNNDTIKTG